MWKTIFSIGFVLALVVLSISSHESVNYIVGGETISIVETPYQAVLLYKFRYYCGAVIIAPYWLLTAAHCLLLPSGTILSTGLLRVRVGTDDANVAYRNNDFEVSAAFKHPDYKSDVLDYDIGLLKVDRRIQYGARIACIDMPKAGMPIPYDEHVAVSGYGSTDPLTPPPNAELRIVDVTIVQQDMCRLQYFIDPRYILTDRMFCAAGDAKDACTYDAGGPAVYQNVVIGIISHDRDCADSQYPGIYTDVASVRDWIDATIAGNTEKASDGRCLSPGV